jgi:hypothetical protein
METGSVLSELFLEISGTINMIHLSTRRITGAKNCQMRPPLEATPDDVF